MTRGAHAPREYVYIRAWGRMTGSFSYYIREQQERASDQGAPVDAVYYHVDERRWVCLSDVAPTTQQRVKEWAR